MFPTECSVRSSEQCHLKRVYVSVWIPVSNVYVAVWVLVSSVTWREFMCQCEFQWAVSLEEGFMCQCEFQWAVSHEEGLCVSVSSSEQCHLKRVYVAVWVPVSSVTWRGFMCPCEFQWAMPIKQCIIRLPKNSTQCVILPCMVSFYHVSVAQSHPVAHQSCTIPAIQYFVAYSWLSMECFFTSNSMFQLNRMSSSVCATSHYTW